MHHLPTAVKRPEVAEWGNQVIQWMMKELYRECTFKNSTFAAKREKIFQTRLSIKLESPPWTLLSLFEKTFQIHTSDCRGIFLWRGQWNNFFIPWAITRCSDTIQAQFLGSLQCLTWCLFQFQTEILALSIFRGAVRTTPLLRQWVQTSAKKLHLNLFLELNHYLFLRSRLVTSCFNLAFRQKPQTGILCPVYFA